MPPMRKLRDNWPSDYAPKTKSRRRKKFGRLRFQDGVNRPNLIRRAHNIAMSQERAFSGVSVRLRRLEN